MPPQTMNPPATAIDTADSAPREMKKLTMEEVAKHGTPKDCWIVMDNMVYDVTKWAPRHPGGPVIHAYGGADASLHFRAFHPPSSKVELLLKKYLIGEVVDYEQPALIKDFAALQQNLQEQGMFNPKLEFWARMFGQIVLMFLVSFYLVANYDDWTTLCVAGFLFAMTQQQSMWVNHDLGHLSVFEKRKDSVFMHTIGHGLLMGASAEWWRRQHNRHHASPNRVRVDPDINTFPFFAWDDKMAAMCYKANKRVVHQAWYWMPVGPIVHRILYTYHWTMFAVNKMNLFELGCMLTHYAIIYGIAFTYRPFAQALAYLFIGYAVWTTSYLWIVAFNHFPMHIYHENAENFVTQQIRTTQNISPGTIMNWWTGHLSMQIEHHLFPRMPRHNLMAVRGEAIKICKKHGLDYRERTVVQGLGDVYGALIAAAKTIVTRRAAPAGGAKKSAKAE